MPFRQSKSEKHLRTKEWGTWLDRNRAELAAMGIPTEVFSDESHWEDFLQNGHLHWHDSSGFDFGQLRKGQLEALGRFLERECKDSPLFAWVKARLEVSVGIGLP